MNIPVINAVAGAFKQIFGVVDQLVEDKDKKNELIVKLAELQNQLSLQLIQTNTVPWVDATVKLLFAFRDIIIPLFRPLIGAALSGYAAYAQANGIPIDPTVQTIFASAFPGWMASRFMEKSKK